MTSKTVTKKIPNLTAVKRIAVNRKATFDYEILEKVEAGLVLKGTEVKSCRKMSISVKEAHVGEMAGALYLFNAHIPEYKNAISHPLSHVTSKTSSHEPKAPRKLLLHKKQMNRWIGRVKEKGLAIIPLLMYFNEAGRVKIEIALARGKNLYDKRESIKKREWDRIKSRTFCNDQKS